jgi:hypothetical protein
MAKIIKSDGTVVENVGTSLKELQKAVGGYIEMVHTWDNRWLIVNEEGKLMGLPVNEEATRLYEYGDHDVIVGDVVVAEYGEID